tara:strand:- start:875 stop:1237 length:363 start_codon:yes stop_codon:yes gene_type:complete
MNEQSLQESLVIYIKLKYNKLRYCSSLGGIRTTMKQAIKAKKSGYVRGFPDLQILEARGGFFGLFIELKTLKGRPTKYQKEWIEDLKDLGYSAQICKGIDQAIYCIDKYMKMNKTPRIKC